MADAAANDDLATGADGDLPAYAELHCLSDFSFLRGASDAMALFERARDCGYSALAITDECSLAGIVRALEASEATGVPLVVGSEFVLADGLKCVLLVQTQAGYTRLCELVTVARRGVDGKGYQLARADVEQVVGRPRDRRPQDEPGAGEGCGLFALWIPGAQPDPAQGRWLQSVFGDRAHLAVQLHRERDDAARLQALMALAAQLGMPALASGDVHMARRRERVLQDTLVAIRHNTPLAQAGALLFRNGERHLRTRRALGNIHPPALLRPRWNWRGAAVSACASSGTTIRSNWCRPGIPPPATCAH